MILIPAAVQHGQLLPLVAIVAKSIGETPHFRGARAFRTISRHRIAMLASRVSIPAWPMMALFRLKQAL